MHEVSVANRRNIARNALVKIIVSFFRGWYLIELELVDLLVLTDCKLLLNQFYASFLANVIVKTRRLAYLNKGDALDGFQASKLTSPAFSTFESALKRVKKLSVRLHLGHIQIIPSG